MESERLFRRCRTWYARLLRLYPRPFRERFGESMEQTFHDLLHERAGRGCRRSAAWMFLETSAGILGEHMTRNTLPGRVLRVLIVTTGLLLVPLTASAFVEGWNWGPLDYVFAWVMFSGTGLGFTFIASRGSGAAYKVAVALAALGVFLLIWINMAVGIIGSEDNAANGMYLGVLILGLLGLLVSRLEPRGMSRTMFAVAAAQMAVPTIALLFWNHDRVIAGESFWGGTGASGVFILNAVFAATWLGSALLFRRATGAPGPETEALA